nr:MAG TPA: tail connector protein [Caudoviricetes sp.]
MTNAERLMLRTGECSPCLIEDLLASATAAIMARRYPFGDWPETLDKRYEDLQYRIALAMYNKDGADYQVSHSENGISRSWSTDGIPESLLQEITPMCKTIGGR